METKEKKEASTEMMKMIIEQMCSVPSGQAENYVRERFKKFKNEEHTPPEMYDFLVEISRIPVTKINDKSCVGDISTFVMELCALDKHYLKPSA